MGSQWHSTMLNTPELVAAFKSDWELGIPLKELAAMYGYTNVNSVTRAARRLGLEPRPGGPLPVALTDGHWELRRGVRVWVEDQEDEEAS